MTIIDGLTGWAKATPIVDPSAATVVRAVYAKWFARYGVPEQLHSDRNTQFESSLFSELCSTFGVNKTRTTPYRPQANGKCERFNSTLVSMLRRAVQRRPYDWEPLLAPVLQTYRSTISESTGFSPFRLAFGREMRLPVGFGTPMPDPPRDVRTLAAELTEDLEWSYRVAREVIGLGHRRLENRSNKHLVERTYPVGSLLRVLLHSRSRTAPLKLEPQYSGLCEVVEVRGSILTLRELDTHRVFTANHDSVRRSTLVRPAAPPFAPPRAAPLPPLPRAAPPERILAAPRPRVQPAPAVRDHPPLPLFGSSAVLPQKPA